MLNKGQLKQKKNGADLAKKINISAIRDDKREATRDAINTSETN